MTLSAFTGRALPLCLLLAGCEDGGPTLSAPGPTASPASALTCTVTLRQSALSCATAGSAVSAASAASANLMVGGQGIYLRLASSGTAYDSATHVFKSNVTVQNLLPGPMGTPDGTTVYGLNVFFHSGPTATEGNGTVLVANPDGVGVFTAAGQPFFHYGVILASNAVSQPREWRFTVDPGVERFQFTLLVETRLPLETGVLRWTARTLCDACSLGQILHTGGDTLLIAGNRGGAGLLLRSFDAGATWDSVRVQVPGVNPLSIGKITGNGPHLYALGAGGYRGSFILRSDDMGLTWEDTDPPFDPTVEPDPDEPPAVEPHDVFAAGEQVFVTGKGCGDWDGGFCWAWAPFMVLSDDGFRTRTRRMLRLDHMVDVNSVTVWGSGPNDVYVLLNEGMDGFRGWFAGVLRSTNGYQSWWWVYAASQDEYPEWNQSYVIAMAGTGHGPVWLLVRYQDRVLGRTTDGGRSWTWENVPRRDYHSMWAAADDQLFVITTSALLRLDGTRWIDQPIGLPGPYYDISGTSVKNIFITTGSGRVLHGTR